MQSLFEVQCFTGCVPSGHSGIASQTASFEHQIVCPHFVRE
jgi:hypothetical protein